LYSATGELLRSLPLGAAPAPASVGVRGAALPLSEPISDAYLVIESVLGVHPRAHLEQCRYYARNARSGSSSSLTAALVMLLVLSLAFSLILREPGYWLYRLLMLMLLAISLRHPGVPFADAEHDSRAHCCVGGYLHWAHWRRTFAAASASAHIVDGSRSAGRARRRRCVGIQNHFTLADGRGINLALAPTPCSAHGVDRHRLVGWPIGACSCSADAGWWWSAPVQRRPDWLPRRRRRTAGAVRLHVAGHRLGRRAGDRALSLRERDRAWARNRFTDRLAEPAHADRGTREARAGSC
jgi:hypothetical protein